MGTASVTDAARRQHRGAVRGLELIRESSRPDAQYYGARLDGDSLVPAGSAPLAATTYDSWLAADRAG